MMPTDKSHQDSLKQLFLDKVVRYCDKCGTKYSLNDIKILQEVGPSIIIQTTCPKCKTKYIIHFNYETQAESKMPTLTELLPFQIILYHRLGKIKSDDILRAYNLLKKSKSVIDFIKKLQKIIVEQSKDLEAQA